MVVDVSFLLLLCGALAAGYCAGRLYLHRPRWRLLVWVEEPPERRPRPRPITALHRHGAAVVYVHDWDTGALRAIQVGRH